MELFSCLIASPFRPIGGITTWTYTVRDYVINHGLKGVSFIDGSNTFKSQHLAQVSLARILLGPIDCAIFNLKLLFKFLIAKPDMLHLCTSASLSLFGNYITIIICKLFRVKIVFHFHFGRIPELAKSNNWEWTMVLKCIKHSYRSIVIDSKSYDVLNEFSDVSKKIFYIPNPVSSIFVREAGKEISEKDNYYIYVGHVVRNKGVFELVKAFAKLGDGFELYMLGHVNEDISNELFKIAHYRADGTWLKLLGNMPSSSVLKYMKRAKALLLPSYSEGFPNVLLESMSCGCPVLATSVGAIPDMINVKDEGMSAGYCFDAHSVDAICKTMEKFNKNIEEHRKFALNGKRIVLSYFTADKVMGQYLNVWGIKNFVG